MAVPTTRRDTGGRSGLLRCGQDCFATLAVTFMRGCFSPFAGAGGASPEKQLTQQLGLSATRGTARRVTTSG